MEKKNASRIELYPEMPKTRTDNFPIASLIVRVLSSVGNNKVLAHSGDYSYVLFWCNNITNADDMIE